MALNFAGNIANSALRAAQYQMSIASANIANASTDGYSRKTSTLVSALDRFGGSGVESGLLTSSVDQLLSKQMLSATSEKMAAETAADYANQLQALYGSTLSSSTDNTGTSIASKLDAFEKAMTNLAGTPESTSLRSTAVSALGDLTGAMRELSAGIQTQRTTADQSIAADVRTVNTNLATIADINKQIMAAKARGDSSADLEDQRLSALKAIAGKMDVRWSIGPAGEMTVYIGNGAKTLVNGDTARSLNFVPASSVSQEAKYPDNGLSGVRVDGVDITAAISGGSMSAQIAARDTELPAAQDEINQLATRLISRLNGISNTATAIPPPTTLAGTGTFNSSDGFSGSGIARVAVTDSSGTLVTYSDLDLSGISTVGGLVSALNGLDGVSASLDAKGHLVISALDSANGVSLGALSSQIGSNQDNLSSYFGMNDLITGTSAVDIKVNPALAAAPANFPTSVLSSQDTLTTGTTVLASGDMTVANALQSSMSGATAFASAGKVGAMTVTFSAYMATIIADKSQSYTSAKTTAGARGQTLTQITSAIASQSGVNLDEETQRLTELQQLYQAASQILKVGNTMFDALLQAVR